MGINALKRLKQRIHESESYWFESAKLEFVKSLNQRVRKLKLKNKDLADKIEASPAYISKVMRGDENLTIETMVKLVRATGGNLHFHITDVDERVRWFGVAKKQDNFASGRRSATFRNAIFDLENGVQRLHMDGVREDTYAA